MINKNTWLLILTALAFSFIFPKSGLVVGPYLNYLFMVLMFLSCLDLDYKKIIICLKDYKEHLVVLLIIHLVSPFIVFLFRYYFVPEIYLGLILITTISAGRSAVFLSMIYGGEPIKALVVTTISNLISPLVVPVIVWIFTRTIIKFNVGDMSYKIFYLVVIPAAVAFMVNKSRYAKIIAKFSSSISTIFLFFIILAIISPVIHIVTNDFKLTSIIGLISIALVVGNFILGYMVGDDRPEKITYALSASYKNYTLATLLALTVFNPTVALPAIVYAITNNLLLVPLQFLRLKK